MSQMTVFSGRERRRRWNDEERTRILAEAFLPGACVAAVARRNDISTSLIGLVQTEVTLNWVDGPGSNQGHTELG
jgi:transposase-like protein